MRNLGVVFRMDVESSMRSKWFWGYAIVIVAVLGGIFATGVTEGRVMGFSGLTRLLLIFIQACNLILPVFILVGTVRTLVKERENSIFEYLLSYPLSLAEYYIGKGVSRFLVIALPLVAAMVFAVVVCFIKGQQVPWLIVSLYSVLLVSTSAYYVGLAFLISSLVKTQETGLGFSLFIWVFLVGLLDVALLGLLMNSVASENVIFSIALLNPVQLFKIAAISLFDPVLSVVGPVAYFILDSMGSSGFLTYAILYLVGFGLVFFSVGYYLFSRKDLL